MNEININEIFGRLTVKRYLGRIKNGRKTWECQCKCGNIVSVTECHLKSGHTKSCGCLKKDNDKKYILSMDCVIPGCIVYGQI